MYIISYHSYMCHPETCNHINHDPWFLRDKHGRVVDKFDSKQTVINYCELTNKEYKIQELTWDDLL